MNKQQNITTGETQMQDDPFKAWCKKWMNLANYYRGPHLQEPTARIKQVLELWNEEVPPAWQRSELPPRLRTPIPQYSRKDHRSTKKGSEHELEDALFQAQAKGGIVFKPYNSFLLLANAYPLAAGRTVEADALALAPGPEETTLIVLEIKTGTNNPWYAAVENLRQLKLLSSNLRGNWGLTLNSWGSWIQERAAGVAALTRLTARGLVLGRNDSYDSAGQKANAAPIARQLAKELERQDPPVHLQFGEWIPAASEICIRQP